MSLARSLRCGFCLAMALLAAGCGGADKRREAVAPVTPMPAAIASGDNSLVGDYAAIWEPATGSVKVQARLRSQAGGLFTVDRGADAFVYQAEASPDREDAAWSPVVRRGAEFEAASCALGPCRLRYRYALGEASKQLDDLDAACEESDIVEAPPSTWLLVPADARVSDPRVRFRVATPAGSRFVTGVFPSASASGAWDITLDDLSTSPYSAFGPIHVRDVPVQGGHLQLAIGPGKAEASSDELAEWAGAAGRAISSYYGRFPMPNALLLVAIARGRWVGYGRTLAGGGGTVFMRVGEQAPVNAFRQDWVLVHEMVHLTFPSVARRHSWAEEGIATYVEPFARVRAGLLDEEEAWGGLAEGLPNGLPAGGDRGLDNTHTWGRIYWGGALFWLLADIEIHKRTNNRFGLEHALRGINEAGGTNATRWPVDRVMTVGDAAVGTTVLRELYAAMRGSPHPVDLKALLTSLGVEVSGGRARFNDHAPLAHVRRSITHGGDSSGHSRISSATNPTDDGAIAP